MDSSAQGTGRLPDILQVMADILFHDPQDLGKLPQGPWLLFKAGEDLLPDGLCSLISHGDLPLAKTGMNPRLWEKESPWAGIESMVLEFQQKKGRTA